MSKNKCIAKSVRITDEVFNYIDHYSGDGFNEKFENIILDAMLSEPKRNSEIKRLDGLIQERKDRLKAASDKLNKMDSIYRNVTQLVVFLSDLSEQLDDF